MSKKYKNIRFHVVGGFGPQDLDISSIKDKIRFYGVQEFKWFKEFYRDKDLIIAPNVPFILGPGAFDGFPVTCTLDAMKNGVCAICSDELDCNVYYKNGYDIEIVKPNKDEIIKKVSYFYDNPKKIKEIGINGKKKTDEAYSYDNQIMPRIKILESIIREGK